MSPFSSKGNITVSFSWILAGIIGVFFLFLSYQLVGKFQAYQTQKFEVVFKKSFNNIVESIVSDAGIEDNKMLQVKGLLSGREFEPLCVGGVPLFRIDDFFDKEGILRENPLFAREAFFAETDATFLGVQKYRLPFFISNLFVVYSPRDLFVFDSSERYEEFVRDFQRSSFSDVRFKVADLEELTLASVENEIAKAGLSGVVFVGDLKHFEKFATLDRAVMLDFEEDRVSGISVFTVTYTDAQGEYEYQFLDMPDDYSLVKAAVFSEPDTFGCSLNLSVDLLRTYYDFYAKKAAFLRNVSESEKLCEPSLDKVTEQILYEDIQTSLELVATSEDIFEQASSIEQVIALQRRLEDFSCVYVY